MKHWHHAVPVALAVGIADLLAGCGGGHTASPASSPTVSVEMKAMGFAPSTIEVHAGQLVKFRFHNAATVVHEALIGDGQAQDAHDKTMAQMGGMAGMNHNDEVQVQPGGDAELSYHFDRPGTLVIGCHEPGHYAAGMRATIEVR
jgi:uncharacterized cupredoxin-like copper-binding protein